MAVAHKIGEKSRTSDVLISESVDFAGLLLSPAVLNGLQSAGFERPSPIQLKAIPLGRCGLDLIVQAKSGTGKTCVFTVIALESIEVASASTQVLVLAPTREIAIQIWEVIQSIGCAIQGLQCHTFIGGLPLHEDKKKLQHCHIAVGTPGRIQNLIEQGCLSTDSIRLFILDEADKLLEESFQEQINWIYSTLPDNKQMLALSATYPEYLADHLTRYMRNPTFIRLNITDPTLLGIKQYYTTVPSHPLPHRMFEAKTAAVVKILSGVSFHQCLIFSNMQTRAQNLESELTSQGWPTTCIAGSLDQRERIDAMAKLKSYKCRVLISTDLTSRGIDADKVNLVINLDVPKDHETYLHRIGRAGRFGSYGAGITIVSEGQEILDMHRIERKISTHILPLPDPIPSDLVQRQLKVNLDDVVSTEQIITQPSSGRQTNGSISSPLAPKSRPLDSNSHGVGHNELDSSERATPKPESSGGDDNKNFAAKGSDTSEKGPDLSEKGLGISEKASDISEKSSGIAEKASDVSETVSDKSDKEGGAGKDASVDRRKMLDSCVSTDCVDVNESGHGIDRHSALDSELVACNKIENRSIASSKDSSVAAKNQDLEVSDSKRFPEPVPKTNSVSNVSSVDFVDKSAVPEGERVEITKAGTVSYNKHSQNQTTNAEHQNQTPKSDVGNAKDSISTESRKSEKSTNSEKQSEDPASLGSEKSDGRFEKPAQRWKKSNSAANAWSSMLMSETPVERLSSERKLSDETTSEQKLFATEQNGNGVVADQIQSTPKQAQSRNSHQAGSMWTNMLTSDVFEDSPSSTSAENSSVSSSATPDSNSSSSSRKSSGSGKNGRGRKHPHRDRDNKKEFEDSFQTELQKYIEARSKMQGKSEEDDEEDDDAAAASSEVAERPKAKARRRTTAECNGKNSSSSPADEAKPEMNSCVAENLKSALDSAAPRKKEIKEIIHNGKGATSDSSPDSKNFVEKQQASNCQNVKQRAISLPPAPKISLSLRAGSKANTAPSDYTSLLQDYKDFVEETPQPEVLTAQELVQKISKPLPTKASEKDLRGIESYLDSFHASVRARIEGGDDTDSVGAKTEEKRLEMMGKWRDRMSKEIEIPSDATTKDLKKVRAVNVSDEISRDATTKKLNKVNGESVPEPRTNGDVMVNGGGGDFKVEGVDDFVKNGLASIHLVSDTNRSVESSVREAKLKDKSVESYAKMTGDVRQKIKAEDSANIKMEGGQGKNSTTKSVPGPGKRPLRLRNLCVCGPATEDLFGFMKTAGTEDNLPDKETEGEKTSMEMFTSENVSSEAIAFQQIKTQNQSSESCLNGKTGATGPGAIPKRPTTRKDQAQKGTREACAKQVKDKKEISDDSGESSPSSSSSSSSSSSADELSYRNEETKDSSMCFQNHYAYDNAQKKKLGTKTLRQRKRLQEENDMAYLDGSVQSDERAEKRPGKEDHPKKSGSVTGKSTRKSKNVHERKDRASSDFSSFYEDWMQSYFRDNGQLPAYPQNFADSKHEESPFWGYPVQGEYPWQAGYPPNPSVYPQYPNFPQPSDYPQPPTFPHHQNYLPQSSSYRQQPGYPRNDSSYPPRQPSYRETNGYPSEQQLPYYSFYQPEQFRNQSSTQCCPGGAPNPGYFDSWWNEKDRTQYHERYPHSYPHSYPHRHSYPHSYPHPHNYPHPYSSQSGRFDQYSAGNPAPRPPSSVTVEQAWATAANMQKYIRKMAKFYARFAEHVHNES